ncbi:MAG: hypothetical protein AAFY05_09060 [Pseudomonadota bacterium]
MNSGERNAALRRDFAKDVSEKLTRDTGMGGCRRSGLKKLLQMFPNATKPVSSPLKFGFETGATDTLFPVET